jgi:hypothetical protein
MEVLYIAGQEFCPRTFGCYFNAALYVTHFDPSGSAKCIRGSVRYTREDGTTSECPNHSWVVRDGQILEVTWYGECDFLGKREYIPKSTWTRARLMKLRGWAHAYALWLENEWKNPASWKRRRAYAAAALMLTKSNGVLAKAAGGGR